MFTNIPRGPAAAGSDRYKGRDEHAEQTNRTITANPRFVPRSSALPPPAPSPAAVAARRRRLRRLRLGDPMRLRRFVWLGWRGECLGRFGRLGGRLRRFGWLGWLNGRGPRIATSPTSSSARPPPAVRGAAERMVVLIGGEVVVRYGGERVAFPVRASVPARRGRREGEVLLLRRRLRHARRGEENRHNEGQVRQLHCKSGS